MPTTSRRGITTPADTDEIADGAGAIRTLAGFVDKDVEYQQGVIASRPTSTAGSPGVAGREYRSTDGSVPTLWKDTGTAWVPLTGVSFSAYPSDSTGALGTSLAKIAFGSEEWDDQGWYDTSTSRFNPKVAGVYRLTASIRTVEAVVNGLQLQLYVYKNGTANKLLAQPEQGGSTSQLQAGGSALVSANGSSDYFEIYALNTGASGLQVAGSSSYFQGELVRVA